jgi:hypothetical protein
MAAASPMRARTARGTIARTFGNAQHRPWPLTYATASRAAGGRPWGMNPYSRRRHPPRGVALPAEGADSASTRDRRGTVVRASSHPVAAIYRPRREKAVLTDRATSLSLIVCSFLATFGEGDRPHKRGGEDRGGRHPRVESLRQAARSAHTSRAAGWPAHNAAAAEPSSRRAGSVVGVRSGPGEPQDDGVADEDSESDRDEGDGGVDEVIEPGGAIGADELGDADQADRAGDEQPERGRKVASGGGPDGRVATQAATGVTIRPPQNPPSGSENSWPPSCWPR